MFFFFNDPPTTKIYTLSLHDALPIFGVLAEPRIRRQREADLVGDLGILRIGDEGCRHRGVDPHRAFAGVDRKSTRLNSSHRCISYAVFCLKKKKDDLQRAPYIA